VSPGEAIVARHSQEARIVRDIFIVVCFLW
jgi:hypothetical protein